jgi:hypothetical protein
MAAGRAAIVAPPPAGPSPAGRGRRPSAISAVGEGADGEVYVVDDLKGGGLYRLVGERR